MQLEYLLPVLHAWNVMHHPGTDDPAGGLGELLSRLVPRHPTSPADDSLSSYDALLNGLGVAVYTTDADGRPTFYHEAAGEPRG